MVRKKTIKATKTLSLEDSIAVTIKEMKVTAKDEKSRVLNDVLIELGQESRVVNSISESDFLEIKKLVPNNEVIKLTIRKLSTADYDTRAFIKYINAVNSGLDPLILTVVNGNTSKNVLTIREKKPDILLDHFREIIKSVTDFAKKVDISDPDYKLPMKFVGQLQNEDKIL